MFQDEMENLEIKLKEISEELEPSENKIKEYYAFLKNIYSNEDFRHSYAELSRFSEEVLPDSRDILIANLDLVLSYANNHTNDSTNDKNIIKRIGKLADHLELETIRLSRIEQIKRLGEKVSAEKKEAEELISQNKEKLEKYNTAIDNMNTQMVSVLGIFSAVVIAFFGGMSYFSSVFSVLKEAPVYTVLMIGSFLGIVVINTIYFLLRYILIIIHKEKIIGKAHTQKYINIFLTIVCIASVVMWILDFRPEK